MTKAFDWKYGLFIAFALVFICGCDSNVISPDDLKLQAEAYYDDCYKFEYTSKQPLQSPPVVEYTMKKKSKGVNEVVITILKQANPGSPRQDVHSAVVEQKDDHDFSFTLPLQASDYPAEFFLGKKSLGKISITVPENSNVDVSLGVDE